MITKDYLKKELATRIAGIKPGVPTTTDLAIGEMKSILVLVEGLQETPLPEDTAIFNKGVAEGRRLEREENLDRDTAFFKGMRYAREQMMKEAVEGEVTYDSLGYNNVIRAGVFNTDFEYGDKVKIIIVKED